MGGLRAKRGAVLARVTALAATGTASVVAEPNPRPTIREPAQ